MFSVTGIEKQIADTVVAFTGYYQFAPGEKITQPLVKSRMLLWCKAGAGIVRVNGQALEMETGDFCFLPWDRSIVYMADLRQPFITGGIHLLPYHPRNKRLVFDVAHRRKDVLSRASWRKDMDWPMLEGIKRGSFAQAPALHHLAEYIVQHFQQRRYELEARVLAQCLMRELFGYFSVERLIDPQIPAPLRRMRQFIQSHQHEKISLRDLVQFSGLSQSAVGRMFQRYLKRSPVNFITHEKIDHAKHLLISSGEQVGEIGRRVGINDPYYFSKLFRKTTGITPLAYRRKSIAFLIRPTCLSWGGGTQLDFMGSLSHFPRSLRD